MTDSLDTLGTQRPAITTKPWKERLSGLWPLAPALAFMLVFFLYPVAMLLSLSIKHVDGGGFTLDNFRRIFDTPVYLRIFLNTFQVAALSALLCVLVSYPVAYLLASISKTWRAPLLLLVMVPLWTSFLVKTIAWIVLLGNSGMLNSLLAGLGFGRIKMIYNATGVLISTVHTLVPITILIMLSVMQNIDRNLMRASATLGARGAHSFWRVYFPLSMPGVVASALIAFVNAMGFFVASQLLGGPRDIMIAQFIVQQIDEGFKWQFAAALGVTLLIITLVVFYLFDKVLGFASLAGDPQRKAQHRNSALRRTGAAVLAIVSWLSAWLGAGFDSLRRLLWGKRFGRVNGRPRVELWLTASLILFFIAAPALVLFPVAFSDSAYLAWPPKGFTLRWFEQYFTSPEWREATVRSIVVGLITATLAMLLGIPAAFMLARRNVPGKRAIIGFLLLPMVVPTIIVAVGLYYLFAQMQIAKTTLAVVLGHTVFAVPYVVITVMTVLRNYDIRLDQAAWTLGANKLATFRHVSFPIVRVGMISAFLFAFLQSFDELTVSLFVADSANTMLPRQLWGASIWNIEPLLAAVAMIMLAIVLIVVLGSYALQASARRRD
ncbi:ABC transporter permease subunit [Rhizobium puerariae]|uniref:ABC transporter permease subunit n=1 Tax=Rhizobium puerariae TaxID=1585791 RepID=A0ABV6ADL7_9HYPH